MIIYLLYHTCPTSFLHQESCISELSHAHAQQKMTTPSRRAMAFILTSVEVSLELLLIPGAYEPPEGRKERPTT